MHIAARIAHRELVELLITDGANINVEDENGWTPLRHATRKYRNVNDVEIIKILIENGADVNAKNDKDGWTPLIWAAKEGDYDLVKLLIAKGADVNAKDDKEKTAFDYVRKYRHKEITELLRKHTGEPRVGFSIRENDVEEKQGMQEIQWKY